MTPFSIFLLGLFILFVLFMIVYGIIEFINEINNLKHSKRMSSIEEDIKLAELDNIKAQYNMMINESTRIDKQSYDVYVSELDKMISWHTLMTMDEKFGNKFREQKAINADIDNEDIIDVISSVGNIIVDSMSEPMKLFLYTYLSRDYVQMYIRDKTMMISIQYYKDKVNELINTVGPQVIE